MSLIVCRNFDWHPHYAGEPINTKECPLFTESPLNLCTADHTESVIRLLDHSKVCSGIPDEKFYVLAEKRQGIFKDETA